jgi:hypothetical protein
MVKHVLGDNTVKFHSTPKKMMPIMAIFRPKMAYLRGICIAIALVWRFYRRHHDLVILDAIASLLLHINKRNKVDSERTRKDEEVGPNPRLLAPVTVEALSIMKLCFSRSER